MTRSLFFLLCFAVGTAFGQESLREAAQGSIPGSFFENISNGTSPVQQRRSIYIQLDASVLFASLKDWKNQLYLSDGTHPSSICTVFGGELGGVIDNHFQIGIGYEAFFSPSVDAVSPSPNLIDQITGSFFYGTLKAGSPFESTPELRIYGALDVGTIKATESLENYGGFNFERSGNTLAYRLKAGVQYYTSDSWSLNIEAGYLVGKITKVSGSIIGPYSLDLSGIELHFGVNYHIPF